MPEEIKFLAPEGSCCGIAQEARSTSGRHFVCCITCINAL
jgi:hypothetical protein